VAVMQPFPIQITDRRVECEIETLKKNRVKKNQLDTQLGLEQVPVQTGQQTGF